VGNINYYLIGSSLSLLTTLLQRNCENHLMYVELIASKISVVFCDTQCIWYLGSSSGQRWLKPVSGKLVDCIVLCSSDLGPDLQNILRQSYNNAKVMIDLR